MIKTDLRNDPKSSKPISPVEQKKSYATVDFMKFAFAICIVALHTKLIPNSNSEYIPFIVVDLIFRPAVPFFFTVSGFFLAKKIFAVAKDKIGEVTKKYCLRLLPMLILWGGIPFIIDFITAAANGENIKYLIVITIRAVAYPPHAMWYISASIIGAIILTFVVRFKRWPIIWAVYSIFTYSFVLLCTNYIFLVDGTVFKDLYLHEYFRFFCSARNGVFLAPVYMGMGFILCKQHVIEWISKNKKIIMAIALIGTVMLFFEATLLFERSYADDRSHFVSYLILIPSIASISLMWDIKLPLPYMTLRKLSTSIYFLHYPVLKLLNLLFPIIESVSYGNIILFVLTVSISIGIALLIYASKNKILNRLI